MIGFSQEQKQGQSQKLSQEQRFFLKLLSMGSIELAAYLEEQFEKNPLLDFDRRTFSYEGSSFEQISGEETRRETLGEFLMRQAGALPEAVPEKVMEFLIYSLDGSGYLRMTNEELARYLPEYTEEELERMIRLMQQLEPTGVFARNLGECLELQLLELEDPVRDCALLMVRSCIDLLGAGRLSEIARICGCTEEEARRAAALIRTLNPRPGSGFGEDARLLQCEVKVTLSEGRLELALLHNYEALQIRPEYYHNVDSETEAFVRPYLGELRLLMETLGARNRTLLAIAGEIVKRQEDFFRYGKALKPLTLKEVGAAAGVHESTVSRAVADKALQFGERVIPMKYFFQSRTAEGAGRDEVLVEMKELIQQEKKEKPLSDQKLADLLGEMGITVSRRAVAKYREQAGIFPAAKRKLLP